MKGNTSASVEAFFLTNGFELLAGNHVSIDFYGGLGVGSIDNFYDDVINPFVLDNNPPKDLVQKIHHVYVDRFIKFSLVAGAKIGYRF